MLDVLVAAEAVIMFDAETGEIPCRHDKLIRQFAATSRGLFDPSGVLEQFEFPSPDQVQDGEYTLSFVHDGRLYTGQLQNNGDWYDVERVVAMVNRALADAGREERFLPLVPEDQTAAFVFGDPALLKPVAEEFHLPLGDDPNAAMKLGRDFEQRAMEALRRGG